MDAAFPSPAPPAADNYSFETLSRSFSSSRLDRDHDPDPPFHHHRRLNSNSNSASSSLSTSPSDPCLYKSASASSATWNTRLNARAPEFMPCSTPASASASASPPSSPTPLLSPSISSSSLCSLSSSSGNLISLAQQSQQSDLAASFVIPRPPGPPALVHIFNSSAAPAATSAGNTTGSIFQLHSSLDPNFGGMGYRGSQLQLYGALAGFIDQPQDLSVLATREPADHSKYALSEEIALKIINQASIPTLSFLACVFVFYRLV